MSIVEEIQQEAELLADLQMARVISEAFQISEIVCPNCNYPQNAVEYEELLERYIPIKIAATRAERRRYRYDLLGFHGDLQYYTAKVILLRSRAKELRALMKPISPCASCRIRFNPTRRVRHGFSVMPSKKEFVI